MGDFRSFAGVPANGLVVQAPYPVSDHLHPARKLVAGLKRAQISRKTQPGRIARYGSSTRPWDVLDVCRKNAASLHRYSS